MPPTVLRPGGPRAAAVLAVLVLLVAGPAPAGARPHPGDPPEADEASGPAAPVAAVPAWAVGRFAWPVDGHLRVPFDPPAAPWGPGHRGVDLVTQPGARVTVMDAGRVAFAGMVAGRAWVSIEHPDVDHRNRLRTTVGPLAVIAVEQGETVVAGQVVGTAAATAHADAATPVTGALHVSARVNGVYVDPTPLVGPWVPTLVAPP